MSIVKFSPIESELFNLKAGRADLDAPDIDQLQKEIITEKYDMCRVKVDSSREDIVELLERLPFPCFFSGALLRYRINFKTRKAPPFRYKSVEFEMYDGSQRKILMDVIRRIFGRHAMNYYAIPYLDKIITQEQARECMAVYFAEHYKSGPGSPPRLENKETRKLWLVKDGDNYGGVLAARIWEDNGDAVLAGVTPEYQNTWLYQDIVRFIQKYGKGIGLHWGYTGARIHQTVIRKFVVKEAMRAHSTELIFYIACFLSRSCVPPIKVKIHLRNANASSVQAAIAKELGKHIAKPFSVSKSRYNAIMPLSENEECVLTLSFPIQEKDMQLAVAQLHDREDNLCAIGYYDFLKISP